jgi:hypothetical protein
MQVLIIVFASTFIALQNFTPSFPYTVRDDGVHLASLHHVLPDGRHAGGRMIFTRLAHSPIACRSPSNLMLLRHL